MRTLASSAILSRGRHYRIGPLAVALRESETGTWRKSEYPDLQLIVGSPAKAIRSLDTAAIDGLRFSARQYVANWRCLKNGLLRIERYEDEGTP
jgi:carbonic anhydrase/acetyltransferase-like protein (isoleucine patch superfamily)